MSEASEYTSQELDEMFEKLTLQDNSTDPLAWMFEDLPVAIDDADEFIRAHIEIALDQLEIDADVSDALDYYVTLNEYDALVERIEEHNAAHRDSDSETSGNSADTKTWPGALRSILLTAIAIALTIAIVAIPA